ncbi:MAG: helix-turn-helix domain-containing protein [Bacteroidales bacterium]|nr:helix-turn-helix domain-containing protein [Bacteroidales bacterium]
MDIVGRLKEYIEYLGMQNSQFADKAQIPRPTLSQILNGRNKKISNELIDKLHYTFPNLNIMWLLFGDGEMVHKTGNDWLIETIDGLDDETESNLFEYNSNEDSVDGVVSHPLGHVGNNHNGHSPKMDETGTMSGIHPNHNIHAENFRGDKQYVPNPYSSNTTTKKIETQDDEMSPGNIDNLKRDIGECDQQNQDVSKKVTYIMVFYSDNSYEMFRPGDIKK